MKKRGRHNYLWTILLIIFSAGLLAAGVNIAKEVLQYKKAQTEYNAVRDDYVISGNSAADASANNSDKSATPDWVPDINIDHTGMFKENADYIGWIYYEDGNISYPICQSNADDPSYYLTHTFLKENNASGCVFIDYNVGQNFTDRNTYLFGHNMADGSMFGSLKKIYNNPAEKMNNPYFYIFLKNGQVRQYRIISMYKTDKNDIESFSVAGDDKEAKEHVQMVLLKGNTKQYLPFNGTEEAIIEKGTARLVTLSTCYGRAGTSKRLLFVGIETASAYIK